MENEFLTQIIELTRGDADLLQRGKRGVKHETTLKCLDLGFQEE